MRKLKGKIFDHLLRRKLRKDGPARPIGELKKADIKRILVVSSTALGDSVFSLPAILSTRNLFPGSEITWLLKKQYLELFQRVKYVDEFMPYHGGYRKLSELYRKIKMKSFDLCLIFHDSDPCPGGTAYLAGVPFILRFGFKDKQLAPYLSARVPYIDEHHAIEQRLDVLREISRSDDKFCREARLETNPEEVRKWSEILSRECGMDSATLVGFQTTAARKYRAWPQEKFIQLGRRLLERYPDVVVILLGAGSERRYCQDIAEGISGERRVINLAGRYGISELPDILKSFDLLVSNDTGPLHVAIAVGTPTVSLFVPSRVEHTGPYQDHHMHKVVKKPPPCDPCLIKYCGDPWCMDLISVEEVFDVIESGLHKCE